MYNLLKTIYAENCFHLLFNKKNKYVVAIILSADCGKHSGTRKTRPESYSTPRAEQTLDI